jgi:hypothetical protein
MTLFCSNRTLFHPTLVMSCAVRSPLLSLFLFVAPVFIVVFRFIVFAETIFPFFEVGKTEKNEWEMIISS